MADKEHYSKRKSITHQKCNDCAKIVDIERMSGSVCDDCFAKSYGHNEADIALYCDQDGKCFECGEELGSWTVQPINNTPRALCMTCGLKHSEHGQQQIKSAKAPKARKNSNRSK